MSHTSRISGWRKQNCLWRVSKFSTYYWELTGLPKNNRRIQDHSSDENSQDEGGNQTQDRVRPGERHDGETDVLGEEQGGSLFRFSIWFASATIGSPSSADGIGSFGSHLLPAAGAILDRSFGLEFQLLANGGALVVVHVGYTTASARSHLFIVVGRELGVLGALFDDRGV